MTVTVPRFISMMCWGSLAAMGAAQAQSGNVVSYLCGPAPFVAVLAPRPPYLTGECSEVSSWGLGAWRTGGGTAGMAPGPLQVGAITVQKARDPNTVALRQLLYSQIPPDPTIELLTIQLNGTGSGDDLIITRLRLFGTRVIAARATISAGSGEDVVELAPERYEFASWNPPGSPTSLPTFVYCRNLVNNDELCN